MSKHFTRLMWRKGNKQTNKKRVFLLQLIVCSGHFGFRAFLILVGTYHARVIRVTSPPCYWNCVLWCLHDIHFCRMADLQREREDLVFWWPDGRHRWCQGKRVGEEEGKRKEREQERERGESVYYLLELKPMTRNKKKIKKEEGED